MFTTPCFIRKNTGEITDYLEEIGYRLLFTARKHEGKFLFCSIKFCFGQDEYIPNDYIDCGTNEELFLAIAALRDDSNEHQWFIWDDDENEGDKWKLYDGNSNWSWWIFEVHKATIEELIKHFK